MPRVHLLLLSIPSLKIAFGDTRYASRGLKQALHFSFHLAPLDLRIPLVIAELTSSFLASLEFPSLPCLQRIVAVESKETPKKVTLLERMVLCDAPEIGFKAIWSDYMRGM